MKRLLLAITIVLAASTAQAGSVTDAPHNETFNIGCNNCHSYSLWWQFSPSTGHSNPSHVEIVTSVCETCHYEGSDIPFMSGHYYPGGITVHRGELGDVDVACTDCHNPHRQDQLNWRGTQFESQLYLVTGEIQYNSISSDNGTTDFVFSKKIPGDYSALVDDNSSLIWSNEPTLWAQKNGTLGDGLIVAVTDPYDNSAIDTYRISSASGLPDGNATVTVRGIIKPTYDDNATRPAKVGLIYGQLIRDDINGDDVRFFNPATTYYDLLGSVSGQGGYVYADPINVDNPPKGLCVTCHTRTANWNKYNECRSGSIIDGNMTIVPCDDNTTTYDPDTHYTEQTCTDCHQHASGFARGSDRWKHLEHYAIGADCADCHGDEVPPLLADGKNIDETTVCENCHNNGALTGYDANNLFYGTANKTDYKEAWKTTDPAYVFGCFGCHNGSPRYLNQDALTILGAQGKCIDTAPGGCKSCHTGDDPDYLKGCLSAQANDCLGCHDGPGGTGSQDDFQVYAVGMESFGHGTLVSTKWIRMYECWRCHYDTVDENYKLSSKHLNQVAKEKAYAANNSILKDIRAEVKMHPDYNIAGLPNDPAAYVSDDVTSGSGICSNTYCHSDGTSTIEAGEVRPYTWKEGGKDCNACHGHDPTQTNCNTSGCHSDGRTGAYWDQFPEKKWLTAMPMYENTGPGTEQANSHYPHLFTGLSCEYCHADTIKADTVEEASCLSPATGCHIDNSTTGGNMAEASHVNGEFHVNGTKDVVFKDGPSAQYNSSSKTCSNTVCHVGGQDQEWGGSLTTALVCRQCHGGSEDVDDFGSFNNIQARINLTQWATTGHGRPKYVDANGTLNTPYPSGNPPADFPDNGCWYCHDSQVLHQNEERPFRLIQHEQFNFRFEKECVFCHMLGEDNECFSCHNEPAGESLAPQLIDMTAPHDHSGYVNEQTSCVASCHPDDASRHDTGAIDYQDQTEKDDVKNAYLQMGVCLKCHDVEANDDNVGDNKCEACHTAPPEEPDKYSLGYDPGLPGTTKITPTKAKASSFHFGYKHFAAFDSSVDDIIYSNDIDDNSTSLRVLVDRDNDLGDNTTWTEDEFLGRRLKAIFSDDNETRSIVRNSDSTITVSPPFTRLLKIGDSYKIIDVVWKGGKFCWDCHDPHGDDNIYMVQNEVATRTDGLVGKPVTRAAVSFTRKQVGTDYARIDPPFNGICNVCHSNSEMYYTATKGDAKHNSYRVCTECHEHRFTDSHASGTACSECHENNRPVPRHTAFGQARNCTKCHADAVMQRMNIMMQFDESSSHHIQGENIEVTDRHCYACHWEATKEGIINTDYHQGYDNKNHSGVSGAEVDLVVWQPGYRPVRYDDGAVDDSNVTAVTFLAKNIDIWSVDSNATLAEQRGEVSSVTIHCLGCHSDQNNDTQPFNLVDPLNGDCKTPRQYAWDRSSIGSRYSDNSTAPWGKYTGANVADKNLQKAFSAHGNAPNNAGGYDTLDGEDGSIVNTRAGLYGVQCFDCHSSHGSKLVGITSSYTTFDGSHNGANLKETQAGKGGYPMAYMATKNSNQNSVNPYTEAAGQCFDCHDSASSNTYLSESATTPWGYNDIFGAVSPIRGYRDSEKFGGDNASQADRGLTDRFAYKHSTLMGGHLNASHRNPDSDVIYDDNGTIWYDEDGNTTTIQKYPINGLCTPCHDPHGISRSLGDDRQYAVPLLKGTWMSSPYKEDVAPAAEADNHYINYNASWSSNDLPPQQRPDGRGPGAWRTDRNTFNQNDLRYKTSHPVQYDRVFEDAEKFAGLCLRCHPKNSLTSDIDPDDNNTLTENLEWMSKDRIHRSVKGWGWNAGEESREHSFTCSKCHSAHVSGLPRLMKTNCLNYQHRGELLSGGVIGASNNNMGSFPFGWWAKSQYQPNSTSICHGSDTANGPSGWPDNQKWNNVTPWGGQ